MRGLGATGVRVFRVGDAGEESMSLKFCGVGALLAAGILACAAADRPAPRPADPAQAVIDEVEQQCLKETVYMIGRKRAERLAELVRQAKPEVVVECGTAIGYSGLWIARELKAAGKGKLITIEIDPQRAKRAEANFRKAGLEKHVTVKVGDVREVLQGIEGPVDFAFIDCDSSNYMPCLERLEKKLRPGATIVADNAGIGGRGMEEYLKAVRAKYKSRIEWFDVDLPWGKRDAMEISVVPK